jgi:hypothetical protein
VVLRRLAVGVLCAVLLAGLAGAFGQGTVRSVGRGSAGELTVIAPDRVRGGLLFQARFEIRAITSIAKPTLVLQNGWLEGSTMTTLEPSPTRETNRAGAFEFEFEGMSAGEVRSIYLDFQVNPAGYGNRSQRVELRDGTRLIASTSRSMAILP